jgi:hypothetical protein
MATVAANLNEQQDKKLEELANAFGLQKSVVLKNLAFNNLKNLKVKDYNLVFAEMLQTNNNIKQMLNFAKQNSLENKEIIFVLYEILDVLKEIKEKI